MEQICNLKSLTYLPVGLEREQDYSSQNISRSCLIFQSGTWQELTDSLLAERYDHVSFPSSEGLVLMGPTSSLPGEVLGPDGTSSPSITPVQEIE